MNPPVPSPSGSTTSQPRATTSPARQWPTGRLMSMDVYRGFVMTLMVAEVFRFSQLHEAFPTSTVWRFLSNQQSHVAWAGCSLHDLIQPSFSFLVGVALPYSMASRANTGQSFQLRFGHALRRSLILILLGIFLRSIHASQTNFTFEDTLTQIGLGYPLLFLLGYARSRVVWLAFSGLLVGYWLLFVLYPLPGGSFNYAQVGVPASWPEHHTGLMAHFNKNSNVAWAFDTWLLNLFPRESPFLFNEGGYATLSFVPTLATMLFGLQTGRWLRAKLTPTRLLSRLLLAGLLGVLSGLLLQALGICPVVKRIWTPAWVLFSGGWCCWLMAGFFALIDGAGTRYSIIRRAGFPLVVVGMNSIAIYCLAHLIDGFIVNSFYTHLGHGPFRVFGDAYEPLLTGLATITVFYLILRWMFRQNLFIRI